MDEGMEECGQRQQGVGREQLNSTALVQLLCLQLPAVSPGSRTLVPVIPAALGCTWSGVRGLLLPSQPFGPVTSFSAFWLLQQETWVLSVLPSSSFP